MNSTVDDGLPWLYGDFSALKLSRSDGVLSINLCNPPLNAMTDEIHTELAAIFPIIDRDEHSRIVVFTGSGERAFCAGGDFEQMLSGMGDVSGWLHKMQQARSIVIGMLECRKPIIGRINGHAIGLGASLALCCDVTVMVDDAEPLTG